MPVICWQSGPAPTPVICRQSGPAPAPVTPEDAVAPAAVTEVKFTGPVAVTAVKVTGPAAVAPEDAVAPAAVAEVKVAAALESQVAFTGKVGVLYYIQLSPLQFGRFQLVQSYSKGKYINISDEYYRLVEKKSNIKLNYTYSFKRKLNISESHSST